MTERKLYQTRAYWDNGERHMTTQAVVREFKAPWPQIVGVRKDAVEVYRNTGKPDPKRIGKDKPHYIWELVKGRRSHG